jgi:hypothetical protein
MSRKNQRWLAAAGLATALLLAVPAPSMAAGRSKPAAKAPSLAARAWAWLESLGIAPGPWMAAWDKEGSAIDPDGVREKEGSMIDPDGVPYVPPPPATSSTATTPTGSPNGAR